ncbi:MAG: hypothetical protein HY854_20675 [Burkholderiales bacterium]|nr:hypothetical protein [Burkholderiales bacterium]
MAAFDSPMPRRRLLLAAAAACAAPFSAAATPIYTPHEVGEAFARRVDVRLDLPANEGHLYAGMAEMHLMSNRRSLLEPQYLLVVDASPEVQAALLMWRLSPGSYQLLGATPVSTGGPVRPEHFETPQGVYEHQGRERASGIYDFGWQRARRATRDGALLAMRLRACATDRRTERGLGKACSDGSIVLPASLMAFLDDFALLDAGLHAPRAAVEVPFRGRHMLVLDSERDRPEWAYEAPPVTAVSG